MGLYPRKINHALKNELSAAGIRPGEFSSAPTSPHREARKLPTEKAAARSGVYKYASYDIPNLIVHTASRVEIPLQMHIGAPAEAIVAAGDRVYHGTLIARPREGALGANIHASIDGRVVSVEGGRIIIEKE
jgi:hypothetical protein